MLAGRSTRLHRRVTELEALKEAEAWASSMPSEVSSSRLGMLIETHLGALAALSPPLLNGQPGEGSQGSL